MHELRIEKREQVAEVWLTGGRRCAGHFFLAGASRSRPDGETLDELINDDSTHFVPFLDEATERVRLLNKRHVARIGFENAELNARFVDPPAQTVQWVTLDLGERTVTGRLYTGDLHPDRRRVVDRLNDEARFALVDSDEGLALINLDLIALVIPE